MVPTVTIAGVFVGVMSLAVPVVVFLVDLGFRLVGL